MPILLKVGIPEYFRKMIFNLKQYFTDILNYKN